MELCTDSIIDSRRHVYVRFGLGRVIGALEADVSNVRQTVSSIISRFCSRGE
ncbi:hypothetical protein PHA8399_00636 [Leisingera aquaemixtae]|uniref:Uncharacterized protein n=1 Tax=Leisingera aquaemixtae TaxID=1396826 RepID=A0A0N7M434_9RHOB|nr:hypothetical protein PHA8399_00636 [Leisingera aquaemixtae]